MDPLFALSPLDGRYSKTINPLTEHLSEFGLIRNRIKVMVQWVTMLHSRFGPGWPELSSNDLAALQQITRIDDVAAQHIKDIETKGTVTHARTNHDVKACELYLRDRFMERGLGDKLESIHFGLTSEDVNNLAYGLMLHDALHLVILPELDTLNGELTARAHVYADAPMLARTHGQPASPTTMGKEFAVYASRLHRQIRHLVRFRLLVKVNGASGNLNALYVAAPDTDWVAFTKTFIDSFEVYNGVNDTPFFEQNELTTQIEPHDTYAELFQIFSRANTVLVDLCQDVWRYVSDDWIKQRPVKGETGSSAMPHKVNPIDFENAESNLQIANVLCEFFARKLPISRLQRDLSDSTVERNFGSALGYMLVAYKAIQRGLDKIEPDTERMMNVLLAHPEVVTEAYQTILRSAGFPNAYMLLKEFSRGKELTTQTLLDFVESLDVPSDVKASMREVRPNNYLGVAAMLARTS